MGKQQFTLDALYEKYKGFYFSYRIELDNLKTVYAEQGGSVNDFAWSIFNKILMELAKSYQSGAITDEYFYEKCRGVYLEMAFFQRRYENKKANDTYQLMLLNDLLWNKAKMKQYQINAIVISSKCCEYCDAQNEKTVPIDEAIKKQPIDSTKCKYQYGCRACYGYSMDRDSEGRVIAKYFPEASQP